MPDAVERFHVLGTYTRDLTPVQTGEFMRSEENLWWPIIRQVNAPPEEGPRRADVVSPRLNQPPGAKAPGGMSLGST